MIRLNKNDILIANGQGNEKSNAVWMNMDGLCKSITPVSGPPVEYGRVGGATLRGRSYDAKPIFGLPHLFELTPSVPLCVPEIRSAVSIELLPITFSNSDIFFCVVRQCSFVVGVMLLSNCE